MPEDYVSSGRSRSTSSVNQPGEQAAPPRADIRYPPDEIIGGDSIEGIKQRILSKEYPYPSDPPAEAIQWALNEAEDLFEVKVEIIRAMTPLDPEGDWPGRGARALDSPHTRTGEHSLANLSRLRNGVWRGDAATIRGLRDRMIWRRPGGDAESHT